eukprot:6487413-Amphidinium_carterae.1
MRTVERCVPSSPPPPRACRPFPRRAACLPFRACRPVIGRVVRSGVSPCPSGRAALSGVSPPSGVPPPRVLRVLIGVRPVCPSTPPGVPPVFCVWTLAVQSNLSIRVLRNPTGVLSVRVSGACRPLCPTPACGGPPTGVRPVCPPPHPACRRSSFPRFGLSSLSCTTLVP